MPEGVEVTIEDGVATIEFLDRGLRGRGVGALLAAGGPSAVTKVTLPRTAYVVPVSVAAAAGMLDGYTPPKAAPAAAPPPKGYDDGLPDMDWSRAAINEYATKVGVASPADLPNKQAVLDAIANSGLPGRDA